MCGGYNQMLSRSSGSQPFWTTTIAFHIVKRLGKFALPTNCCL